jgi:hypothetical protein
MPVGPQECRVGAGPRPCCPHLSGAPPGARCCPCSCPVAARRRPPVRRPPASEWARASESVCVPVFFEGAVREGGRSRGACCERLGAHRPAALAEPAALPTPPARLPVIISHCSTPATCAVAACFA